MNQTKPDHRPIGAAHNYRLIDLSPDQQRIARNACRFYKDTFVVPYSARANMTHGIHTLLKKFELEKPDAAQAKEV